MGGSRMSSNILITGGGGFLGRYTARCLRKAGNNVTILGRNSYPWALKEGFNTIQSDICDRPGLINAFKGFDEVHHMAAKTGISVFWRPFYEINVRGTENVISACMENGIRKLIYTSSPSVVYGAGNQDMIDETKPYPEKYLSHYSRSKAMAEQLVLSANKPGGKLLTVALRPHLIWGPEDTNLIPRLVTRSEKNRLFIIGNAANKVDVTYVENAAMAQLLSSEKLKEGSTVCGKAYFITNDEPVLLWDFINRVLACAG
ncbi:NAD-dependent epimerase/dehydratase family protein, partial [Elusimicrobiota bacterium]